MTDHVVFLGFGDLSNVAEVAQVSTVGIGAIESSSNSLSQPLISRIGRVRLPSDDTRHAWTATEEPWIALGSEVAVIRYLAFSGNEVVPRFAVAMSSTSGSLPAKGRAAVDLPCTLPTTDTEASSGSRIAIAGIEADGMATATVDTFTVRTSDSESVPREALLVVLLAYVQSVAFEFAAARVADKAVASTSRKLPSVDDLRQVMLGNSHALWWETASRTPEVQAVYEAAQEHFRSREWHQQAMNEVAQLDERERQASEQFFNVIILMLTLVTVVLGLSAIAVQLLVTPASQGVASAWRVLAVAALLSLSLVVVAVWRRSALASWTRHVGG